MEEDEKITRIICSQIEEQIKKIGEQSIQPNNVEFLYKLIDIKKDIYEIKNMKEEEEMRYREYGRDEYGYGNYGEYGEYGRGSYGRRERDSRGRYNEGGYGEYGRRGYDAKYRGDNMMDDMNRNYHEYADYRDSYGANESTIRSLDKMLKATERFMQMLSEEATSEEEMQMIKETAKRISEM